MKTHISRFSSFLETKNQVMKLKLLNDFFYFIKIRFKLNFYGKEFCKNRSPP